jgi:hypothetical protein
MATGGLYGQSSAGIVSPQTGSESSGLYGNNTVFGGTYFEWFIFQESSTQPATPTGGSWNFLTNTGTVPSGWTQSPPTAPTNEIWVSIALVNSKTTSSFTWSTPGLLGVIASTNVGTTTTGAAGTLASVTNSGTPLDAVLNFTIPRGNTGATGNAATIAAGTTTTTAPGTSASVTNSGTSGAAVFDFNIPRGAGVNSGGSVGQVLTKASGTDYDTTWTTIIGTLNYQGSWNASTNSPTLTSSVGTNGYYYVVGTAGSTNLNGITDWQVGDWAIFNGSVWQKLDQTNLVTSVAGRTGAVVLSNTDISGLGTMSTQNANAVTITGGTINGATVGATTAAAITGTVITANTNFASENYYALSILGGNLRTSGGTSLLNWDGGGSGNITVNGGLTATPANKSITLSPSGTGTVTINPATAGTINNMSIGATTPLAGAFTTLSATSTVSGAGFTAYLASPPAIGGAAAAAGTFTTLTATADSAFTSTGAVQLSKGTTAQRPAGVSGKLRFNTDTTQFEGYNGTTWASVGGAAISNDTSTSTNVYPLFAAATSGTALTVYTSNAKYLYKPSTGDLQASQLVASNGIVVNSQTVSVSYTIPTGSSAMSSGPVTVASGQAVTISSGSRWIIL